MAVSRPACKETSTKATSAWLRVHCPSAPPLNSFTDTTHFSFLLFSLHQSLEWVLLFNSHSSALDPLHSSDKNNKQSQQHNECVAQVKFGRGTSQFTLLIWSKKNKWNEISIWEMIPFTLLITALQKSHHLVHSLHFPHTKSLNVP